MCRWRRGGRGWCRDAGLAGGARQGPDGGQDLRQQARAGGQPHDQLPAVAHQPGGDGDQPAPQGGDHRLAAADPVPFHQLAAQDEPGELVQPGRDRGGDQRRPHPRGVDLFMAGGQVAQRGAVLAVAEDVLDAGAVPVPVLHRGGPGRGGHVQVGADEAVGVDGRFLFQFRDRQGPLVRVQGAAAPGPGIGGDLIGVQLDPADQQHGVFGPVRRPVRRDRDLRVRHVYRVPPGVVPDPGQRLPHAGDPLGADREGHVLGSGGAGQLPGEIPGIGAQRDLPPGRRRPVPDRPRQRGQRPPQQRDHR